ncbi:hypothetical protein Tco_1070714 [Tanacetum coccineum]|uniref:Uncharacterized protein n=1 Tax=Tanacetum coccineum TaxID=301880 RepID=A0ABQ5HM84_9ASTR
MSSPNHSTSDLEDAFSSIFLTTLRSHRIISSASADIAVLLLFGKTLTVKYDSNLSISHLSTIITCFEGVQAFYAKELPISSPDPITPPAILTPSPVLPPSSLLFDPRYFFVPKELLPPKK